VQRGAAVVAVAVKAHVVASLLEAMDVLCAGKDRIPKSVDLVGILDVPVLLKAQV
jgi:hypothetical protein